MGICDWSYRCDLQSPNTVILSEGARPSRRTRRPLNMAAPPQGILPVPNLSRNRLRMIALVSTGECLLASVLGHRAVGPSTRACALAQDDRQVQEHDRNKAKKNVKRDLQLRPQQTDHVICR